MDEPVNGLQTQILEIERAVALLSYCSPLDFEAEVGRCARGLAAGKRVRTRFCYRDLAPSFGGVERSLEQVRRRVEGRGGRLLQSLLDERVSELELEWRIVKDRGGEAVRDLSRLRYPFSSELYEQSDALARDWLGEAGSPLRDEAPPLQSLSVGLSACALRDRLPIPIAERDIASVCATTEDGIWVKRGRRASPDEIERLWIHEVWGHYLPRRCAKRLPAPLQVGTAGASEDEEGRALLLEERSGFLHSRRRQALAIRHLVARAAVQSDARAEETAASFVETGHCPRFVAESLCRALRAGGLGRERIYLPAFLRVKSVLAKCPRAESWLAQGRFAVAVARQWTDAGLTPGGDLSALFSFCGA